jgi:hypothetical protein
MKYYHVTGYYRENEFLFQPGVPGHLVKGEDKTTPRICVTTDWRISLTSIILLRLAHDRFYVYSTEAEPVDPNVERERLLASKAIRRNQNKFRLPPDGQINKEKWFIQPTKMKLEGMVVFPKEQRAMALMGMGMVNDPDISKFVLEPYKPWRSEVFGDTI